MKKPPNTKHQIPEPRALDLRRPGRPFVFLFLILAKCSVLSLSAADPADLGRSRLTNYRAELQRFRDNFGGTRELPDEHFFLFGLGLRPKLLYRHSALVDAVTGIVIRQWDVAEEVIVPPDYAVYLRTRAGDVVGIVEDESGVWIEAAGKRELLPGANKPVRLPDFKEHLYPQVLRVLH